MQKDHDLPHDLLLGPSVGDPVGANRPDTRHFAKSVGLGLDDVEYLVRERLDQFLRVNRPNAAYHARAQIFFDTVDRTRRRRLQKPRPELLAVRVVVGPFA